MHCTACKCERNVKETKRNNALKIRWEMENGGVLMVTECRNNRFPGSLCLPCYPRNTAWNLVLFDKDIKILKCQQIQYNVNKLIFNTYKRSLLVRKIIILLEVNIFLIYSERHSTLYHNSIAFIVFFTYIGHLYMRLLTTF